MRLTKLVRQALFIAFISSNPAFSAGETFTDKAYQEGFDEGVSYAIAALAYKAYGMANTPYPVEMPDIEGWDKTYQKRTAIHTCVREHVTRDLAKAGGATHLLYESITNIANRVLAYCGAEKVQIP